MSQLHTAIGVQSGKQGSNQSKHNVHCKVRPTFFGGLNQQQAQLCVADLCLTWIVRLTYTAGLKNYSQHMMFHEASSRSVEQLLGHSIY